MEKAKMNQDELYQYLLSHNLTIKRLGELIGQCDTIMSSAFKHHKMNGKPLYFSAVRLTRINEALPVMADEITSRLLKFNPENNISPLPNRRYDPGCVDQLRRVGDYFNIKGLTARVLGWTKAKKESVFTSVSKGYGHITEADVTAINTELLAVAGVLRAIEIVPMSE